jgi:hypothetical protein
MFTTKRDDITGGRWRVRNGKRHDFYYSHNTGKTRRAESIARTGDRGNYTNTLKGRQHFKYLSIEWNNIEADRKVTLEGVESIDLAQEMDLW